MGVMSVKRSVTTPVSHSSNEAASARSLDAGASSVSAMDEQKALDGKNIGDVLNKVADSNWVDPSKKVRATGNAQLDKNAFMKLMLAQMKYQDPQNPMQSHEMAAQLAQFTSLEQLNNIHTTLEGMKTAQTPSVNYQALNFIGKKIASDSSRITRSVGDTNHSMSFQLLGDASKTKVVIKDAAGNPVRKLDFGPMKKGANSVSWNGLTDDGVAARPGEYKMTVESESAAGTKVYAKTQLEGRITGLNYTAEGPVLMVGDQTVKMSEVKKIEEAGPEGAGAPGANPLTPQTPLNAKEAILQSMQQGQGATLNAAGMPTATHGTPQMPPGIAEAMAAAIPAGMSATAPTATQAAPLASAAAMPKIAVKPELKDAAKAKLEAEKKAASKVEVQAESKTGHGLKSEIEQQDSKVAKSDENMNVPPAEEPTAPPGNIDSVPMAQGLINKLAQAK